MRPKSYHSGWIGFRGQGQALDVQPKLLRFLESGEIHPLGESRPLTVDLRVISATNAPLEQYVSEGRFREDLYYWLNVHRFRMPPLRERREEIPPLVHQFLQQYAQEENKGRLRLAEETLEYLLLYPWPGNVRELANEIRRLVSVADVNAPLRPEHLSPEILAARRTVPASQTPGHTDTRGGSPLHQSRPVTGPRCDRTGASDHQPSARRRGRAGRTCRADAQDFPQGVVSETASPRSEGRRLAAIAGRMQPDFRHGLLTKG